MLRIKPVFEEEKQLETYSSNKKKTNNENVINVEADV
jgi:hypothetical protein